MTGTPTGSRPGSRLELSIPPDVVWAVVAILMWLASGWTPRISIPTSLRFGATVAFTLAGGAFVWAARAALAKANTTWHPTTPSETTHLVTSGVFGMSRNPIYLGMLLVLFGLAVLLSSPVALLVSALFVVYLDRFQVTPEERALLSKVGREYREYRKRVRRWV